MKKLTCQSCGEQYTEKQSRGHAHMFGHYTFTAPDGSTVNHSSYRMVNGQTERIVK